MTTPEVEFTIYTDPYCSWCWAVEPVLYRLSETFRDQIAFRHVMGGMVQDLRRYGKPGFAGIAEVAPHWRMVSERSGQPIDERLMTDINDPNYSTWPSCVATKAAQMQSSEIGEAFLRRIRRAALTERAYVSDPPVYEALASDVPELDLERFKQDIASGAAEAAFMEDLQECAAMGVTGFPTILVRAGEQGVIATGYRPFETYLMAIEHLEKSLEEHEPREVGELLVEYGPLTTRELAELYVRPDEDMFNELSSLVEDGSIEKFSVPSGEFWLTPGTELPILIQDEPSSEEK